jgi:hypothetical protein
VETVEPFFEFPPFTGVNAMRFGVASIGRRRSIEVVAQRVH